jgi:hypothetical protein
MQHDTQRIICHSSFVAGTFVGRRHAAANERGNCGKAHVLWTDAFAYIILKTHVTHEREQRAEDANHEQQLSCQMNFRLSLLMPLFLLR